MRRNVTVRGQYRAGASGNGPVPGYLEELGAPSSKTETFVAIKAEIENWRWAGVPFFLRTGKRLGCADFRNRRRLQAHSAFGLRRHGRPDHRQSPGHPLAARRRRAGSG